MEKENSDSVATRQAKPISERAVKLPLSKREAASLICLLAAGSLRKAGEPLGDHEVAIREVLRAPFR
jgi:hypothetical protein